MYKHNNIKTIDDYLILELNEYQSPQQNKEVESQTNKPLYNDKCKYDITNDDLMIIFSHLPDNNLNDYLLWLCLTYIFKRHNILDLWNEWSKKSNKYNEK
jgi:hypothetical protein